MKKNQPGFLNIKNWAAEDRPREKLLLKGTAALTDAELIAILLGTGTASTSAVDLAKNILQTVNNNLDDLARLSVNDLMKIKGIGRAKAITIISALELGRRRKETSGAEKPKVTSSTEAYALLKSNLMDKPHEEFWVLLLNRASRLIKIQQVSQGGVHGTVADPKIIFKTALEELASAIIVAHNHPSGNLTPSQQDVDLTKKLKESARLLDITLTDHLIIAGKDYFSFADEGML
ncbi:MAG: DNA repair protein RadC [Cyclobacteriaceae bacterium]|nr:DNA repair protein RadC [Cyclobacteriaceae bacterium]